MLSFERLEDASKGVQLFCSNAHLYNLLTITAENLVRNTEVSRYLSSFLYNMYLGHI